jgi:dolichol-phosphate mannosyltransferase
MSSPAPELSVVVPLFNEEGNVQRLVAEVDQALAGMDYELVLVDDASTDETVSRIPRGPRVKIVEFAQNAGQSAAMHCGINEARGAIIALMDGDLQNDPADIPKMLAKLHEGFDLVCGWRVSRKDTAFKRVQSRIANFVRSRFTGDGVHDTGCTLKVMRRECRATLPLFRGMHRFIPAFVKGGGFRITEMPVNHRPRTSGVSKYGFGRRAMQATRDMFGVKWLISRGVRVARKEGE